MTHLPKAPAAVHVDAAGGTVVAGQPVAMTVRPTSPPSVLSNRP
jgi:hypothetical protein